MQAKKDFFKQTEEILNKPSNKKKKDNSMGPLDN